MPRFPSALLAINYAYDRLKDHGEVVDPGTWQGVKTDPSMVTQELLNLQIEFPIPLDAMALSDLTMPNLPWAEDHFQERVSRVPSNPGEQYKNWPWWRGQDAAAMVDFESEGWQKFTHTYQERFWPKRAGDGCYCDMEPVGQEFLSPHDRHGIRYQYGDLDDVVNLLRREPHTRQATFPIFFPEDTGAVHQGRVPCTLHYHLLLRNNKLHCWYPIRSCDAVRHFRDDLYMACRLVHWVLQELFEEELRNNRPQLWVDVEPGIMHFTAYSFHVHMGDRHLVYEA